MKVGHVYTVYIELCQAKRRRCTLNCCRRYGEITSCVEQEQVNWFGFKNKYGHTSFRLAGQLSEAILNCNISTFKFVLSKKELLNKIHIRITLR